MSGLRRGRCKYCGAPLTFATTKNGKLMPLNPMPDPEGNVESLGMVGSELMVKVLSIHERPAPDRMHYTVHFVDCPNAKAARRR